MLKIFAKYGTSEKVLACCDRGSMRIITRRLSEAYGGDWALVDTVDDNKREILKFDDGLKYFGFDATVDRYSTAINKL